MGLVSLFSNIRVGLGWAWSLPTYLKLWTTEAIWALSKNFGGANFLLASLVTPSNTATRAELSLSTYSDFCYQSHSFGEARSHHSSTSLSHSSYELLQSKACTHPHAHPPALYSAPNQIVHHWSPPRSLLRQGHEQNVD